MKNEPRKTRICFIQTQAYALFKKTGEVHGGSEVQLYFIAEKLSEKKIFDIRFIVGDFGQKKIEIHDGIRLYKSFTPKGGDGIIKKLIQAIRYFILFQKIDADFYVTSAANSTVGIVGLFCKIFRKKHIHRTAHVAEVNGDFAKRDAIFGKIYEYGLKNASTVTAQGETYQKILWKTYHKKSIVLKNGFPLQEQNIKKSGEILWVARCTPWKRPEIYLKMAQKLSDQKFIMICPPASERETFWQKIHTEAGNVDNLKFIKKVPFADIQTYFNRAKIFVNTSENEGFPNTFIQAGMGKTPIISLRIDPDNFLETNRCGFQVNDDIDKAVEKIQILCNDVELYKEYSENILRYVKDQHDAEKNAGIFEDIINQTQQ